MNLLDTGNSFFSSEHVPFKIFVLTSFCFRMIKLLEFVMIFAGESYVRYDDVVVDLMWFLLLRIFC